MEPSKIKEKLMNLYEEGCLRFVRVDNDDSELVHLQTLINEEECYPEFTLNKADYKNLGYEDKINLLCEAITEATDLADHQP